MDAARAVDKINSAQSVRHGLEDAQVSVTAVGEAAVAAFTERLTALEYMVDQLIAGMYSMAQDLEHAAYRVADGGGISE
jgi:hypothetical protein